MRWNNSHINVPHDNRYGCLVECALFFEKDLINILYQISQMLSAQSLYHKKLIGIVTYAVLYRSGFPKKVALNKIFCNSPGRFNATVFMKVAITQIIKNYDLKLLNLQANLRFHGGQTRFQNLRLNLYLCHRRCDIWLIVQAWSS